VLELRLSHGEELGGGVQSLLFHRADVERGLEFHHAMKDRFARDLGVKLRVAGSSPVVRLQKTPSIRGAWIVEPSFRTLPG
jgi:hypothetical protein